MSFTLQGKLIKRNDAKQVSDKFTIREFVIEDSSTQYPQLIQMQLTQDRVDILDSFQLGENVSVSFNIKGREWTSPQGDIRYFTTLEAWKIDSMNSSEAMASALENAGPGVDNDDLPF